MKLKQQQQCVRVCVVLDAWLTPDATREGEAPIAFAGLQGRPMPPETKLPRPTHGGRARIHTIGSSAHMVQAGNALASPARLQRPAAEAHCNLGWVHRLDEDDPLPLLACVHQQ